MAGPHGRVDTVCSIEVREDLGQALHRNEAIASRDRASCAFFRELAGRTVDSVLFK